MKNKKITSPLELTPRSHTKLMFVIIAAFGFLASCTKPKKNEAGVKKSPIELLLSINEAHAQNQNGLKITTKGGVVIKAAQYLQPVEITATLSSAEPSAQAITGVVIFEDNNNKIVGCEEVTISVDNTASCLASFDTLGQHTIKASYEPRANQFYEASTSKAGVTVVIAETKTTITNLTLNSSGALEVNIEVKNKNNAHDNTMSGAFRIAESDNPTSTVCGGNVDETGAGHCTSDQVPAGRTISYYAMYDGDDKHENSKSSPSNPITRKYKTNIDLKINPSAQQMHKQQPQLKRQQQPQQQTPILRTPH